MNKEIKERLEELIPSYACVNAEFNKYKKQNETQGKELKQLFTDNGLTEYTVGDCTATVTETHKESFDEAKLIAIVKKMKVAGIIKKKEYIDEAELERAIYDGKINAAALEPAQTVTLTPTLKLKR